MTVLLFVVAFCLAAVLVYMLKYSGRLRFALEQTLPVAPSTVFQSAHDLATWVDWNPWQEHDPATAPELTRNAAGEVETFGWHSERVIKVSVHNIKAIDGNHLVQRLTGKAPFNYSGKLTWRFAPAATNDNAGTTVTLTFKGRIGFAQRAFAKTVQTMLALDFGYALNRLEAHLTGAAGRYQIAYLGAAPVAAHTLYGRRYEGPSKQIGVALQPLLAALRQRLACPPTQPGEVHYLQTNLKTGISKCRYGFADLAITDDALETFAVPAHTAFVTRLTGDLAGLETAWYKALQQMRAQGLQPDQRTPPSERYVPAEAADALPHVDLYFPLRAVPVS